MSEPENFLSRWARRKQEADEPQTDEPIAAAQPPAASGEAVPAPGREEPFDLSKLPAIDSISAETDMRVFMQPGVPPELTRAALRRVWVTDPAIRDFVGLQENDWDFNATGGVAGFGPIGPEHNVGEMVARLFGDGPAKLETSEPLPTNSIASAQPPVPMKKSEVTAAPAAAPSPVSEPLASSTAPEPPVAHEKDIAMQQDERETGPRHGSAMPKVQS